MKRPLIFLIVISLVLGFAPMAFAAENPLATMTADKSTISAGETITLAIAIDKPIENLNDFQFNIYFDDTLFSKTAQTIGNAYSATQVGNAGNNSDGAFVPVSGIDINGDPFALNGGIIATVTFTAKKDITETITAEFSLVCVSAKDYDTMVPHTVEVSEPIIATITVTETSEPADGYTAGLSTTTPAVSKNSDVIVNVGVAHKSDGVFNAAEIVLNYDSSKLSFKSVTNSINSEDGLKYTVNNGTLTIQDFGDDKNFDTANYVVTFTATEVTDENTPTTVTLHSAKFIHKANANSSDLVEVIEKNPASVNITISKVIYAVSLPSDGILTGDAVAVEGEDYTFEVADPDNYDYTITVAVGGTKIDTVTGPDANGKYTIPATSITDDVA